MSAHQILRQAADVFEERHAVYGDNYKKLGAVMAALFPDGITLKTVDDHNRFHLILLKVVKMTRYLENWNRGGHEDSMIDDAVYAAMVNEIDREISEREKKWHEPHLDL